MPNEAVAADPDKDIRDRIVNLLTVYPRLSPSMLQIGLGTSLPPTIWRPILTDLINDGTIKDETETSNLNRPRIHRVLSLEKTTS